MDISLYIERIKFDEPVVLDIPTLFGLHRAHMLTVPFENRDVAVKRPIMIDEKSIWKKLVENKRGGFCYELNGLFAWLLKQIGFDVTYLNARVYGQNGSLGIEFGHLTLLVQIPGESVCFLADVGFGDSFNEPLRLEVGIEQEQDMRTFRLEKVSTGYAVWRKDYDGTLERQYYFDLTPHKFPEEYETGCLYHQTSPKSRFTSSTIISRATEDGRVSLHDGRLIITRNGQRIERTIANKEEYDTLLRKFFDVE